MCVRETRGGRATAYPATDSHVTANEEGNALESEWNREISPLCIGVFCTVHRGFLVEDKEVKDMAFDFIKEIDWKATACELVKFTSQTAVRLGKKGAKAAAETASEAAKKIKDVAKAVEEEVKADIESVKQRDPAAKNGVEILLLYSGVHAIFAYRVAHKLYVGKHFFSARLVSQMARFFTGIEIHPGATIGKGLFIDHGAGVVIGETAEIGDNCTLYQGVTLGGTGKDVGKRHPTLGNNVMVGSGAKVLGPFKIGDNSKIASNAVVLDEIPADSTAVGIPARVVKRGGRKVDNMDQIHIPDPVSQELCRLEHRIAMLEKELKEKEEG